MSKTRSRAHVGEDEFAARRNTRRRLRVMADRNGKTAKQDRVNKKVQLRKEHR